MTSTFYHLKGFNLQGVLVSVSSRSLTIAYNIMRRNGVRKVHHASKVSIMLNLNATA